MSSDSIRVYICQRRRLLGISQADLARALNLPHSTYSCFERRQTYDLKADVFVRLVPLLRIPHDHILLLGDPRQSLDTATHLAGEQLPLKALRMK